MALRKSKKNNWKTILSVIISLIILAIITVIALILFDVNLFEEHPVGIKVFGFIVWVIVGVIMDVGADEQVESVNNFEDSTTKAKVSDLIDLTIFKENGSLSDIENITNLINQVQKNTMVDSTNERIKLYLQRGKIYNYLNKQGSAIDDFVIVKTIAEKLSNTELVNIANQQYKAKNYVDALFFYSIIIDKKDCIKEKDIPETYYTMALICIELNQTQKAKKILQVAVDKAKAYSQTLSYVEVEDYQNKRINKYLKALNILNTQKTKYCSYCGEPVDENATVCSLCNQPLSSELSREEVKTEINNKPVETQQQNETINLETCTKEDLLTLAGFDETKAEKFISERNNGKQYYDIDSLVAEFEIQPHEMIEIESRLIFAQRPKNKAGRRVDW